VCPLANLFLSLNLAPVSRCWNGRTQIRCNVAPNRRRSDDSPPATASHSARVLTKRLPELALLHIGQRPAITAAANCPPNTENSSILPAACGSAERLAAPDRRRKEPIVKKTTTYVGVAAHKKDLFICVYRDAGR
jgi:hypothetical protein